MLFVDSESLGILSARAVSIVSVAATEGTLELHSCQIILGRIIIKQNGADISSPQFGRIWPACTGAPDRIATLTEARQLKQNDPDNTH